MKRGTLRTGKQERWVGCSELPAGVCLGARGRVRWPGDSKGSPGWGRPRASQVAPEGRGHGSGWKGSPACRQAAGGPGRWLLPWSRDTRDPVSCHVPRRPPPGEQKWCVQQGCGPLPHVPGCAHRRLPSVPGTRGRATPRGHVPPAPRPPGPASPRRTASDLAHTHNTSPLTGRC